LFAAVLVQEASGGQLGRDRAQPHAPAFRLLPMQTLGQGYKLRIALGMALKPRSDGRFTSVQLAADRAPIYLAEDHQKKLPSDFAALATHTGDHGPLRLMGSAYSFARPHRLKRCLMLARIRARREKRLHSELQSL
jgi:hypothetical protein